MTPAENLVYSDTQIYKETVEYFKVEKIPKVAIICGSGLGNLANGLKDAKEFEYKDIPHFPVSTVEGHQGKLVFGKLNGIDVVCMVGRFHFYEGYSAQQITFPVRVFALMGIKNLLVTNASGSLNPDYKVGDIMIIKDHINLVGMTGWNPLLGKNNEHFGPRFPAMNDIYNKEQRNHLKSISLQIGIPKDCVHEGVYVYISGPSYETKAEARYLRFIGADAVGMSTVPEVLVAKHSGMNVVGLALISNKVIQHEDSDIQPPTHSEVLSTTKLRAREMERLVEQFVNKL